MKRFLLDTNIYDLLESDSQQRKCIKVLVKLGTIKIFITRTIVEELKRSPFEGVPKWFSINYEGNTVACAGIMCSGDRLGDGEVFYEHKGESRKRNDALIADAANCYVDYLVSEDKRMRLRADKYMHNCDAINYEKFIEVLYEM